MHAMVNITEQSMHAMVQYVAVAHMLSAQQKFIQTCADKLRILFENDLCASKQLKSVASMREQLLSKGDTYPSYCGIILIHETRCVVFANYIISRHGILNRFETIRLMLSILPYTIHGKPNGKQIKLYQRHSNKRFPHARYAYQ